MGKTSCKKGQYYCNTDKKCKPIPDGYKVREDGFLVSEGSNPRIPRKAGQPAKSKKHSDLYTDEDPKGTIHGLGFKDVATAKASVAKIRKSSRSHAHKIQAAIAMEQRARVMGKTAEAAVYRKFINSMKKKTKAMNEEKHGDHEYEMIRRQTDNIMVAAKKLKKKVGKGEGNAKAWVQSKITKAADYLDTAADYMTDKDSVKEGSLHKWFSGSKSKDGKGGWVNVRTGGTCASDEPGEGVPKCVSRSKYDSMSKKERESASRRKKAADPNQQKKTGAAKPTYVATDKPKKKMKEEFVSLPLQLEIPQSDGEFKLGLMFRESLEQDKGMLFIFENNDYHTFHMKNTFIPLDIAFMKEDGTIDSIEELDPMNPIPVAPDSEIRYAVEVNRGWFAENDVNVGDVLLEEEDLTEGKDKKGKGSGSKDACYYKVKSRYSVWPSAYASGALVKCRKVGAANWGNKSESVEYEVNEGMVGKALKLGGLAAAGGIIGAREYVKRGGDHENVPVHGAIVKGVKSLKKKLKKEHYSWRDSFDLEERTIAQQNSMQQRNKDAARSRAQELAKQRIGSGTAKNPDTTIAQAKQQNQASMRTNARARNVDFRAERRPAAKPMASNPQGMRQQGVGKSANDLSRHSAGSSAAAGAAKPAAGKPGLLSRIGSGIKRVAGGVADAATGNKFDFDKRGGQKSAPKIAGSGNVGGSGARAQDALNRNPNPPQKQDALNRSKEKPGATPATNTGGMRPTNTGNARRDNFNAKVNTLKNKQKYGGTGNPITIGDKTYNPQDKGYKDAFNTVSSAVTKSQKNIGVDTSPGKSDSTSLVNNNKKKNIKNANKVTNQMNNLSKKEAEFTGEPAGKTTVGKIDFGGF